MKYILRVILLITGFCLDAEMSGENTATLAPYDNSGDTIYNWSDLCRLPQFEMPSDVNELRNLPCQVLLSDFVVNNILQFDEPDIFTGNLPHYDSFYSPGIVLHNGRRYLIVVEDYYVWANIVWMIGIDENVKYPKGIIICHMDGIGDIVSFKYINDKLIILKVYYNMKDPIEWTVSEINLDDISSMKEIEKKTLPPETNIFDKMIECGFEFMQ